YWDGDRKYGYGGYKYDGRWAAVAEKMIAHYNLPANARILDVGCGKGFLLYELKKLLPKAEVKGIDISSYAVENAKEEIRERLQVGNAAELPFKEKEFDLVYSITTLHNLYNFDLKKAVREIQRVSKKNSFIMVESYRNEKEKANLLYWQLTCESFLTPQEWVWLFDEYGYTGDYEFIFFE
ncbi:MAG: class I SAM-dependent methyltransferase, partial [Nitrospinae bacterium]|nr:class I SAM-dependent methyltransferase [Nitrospinota bacterium]